MLSVPLTPRLEEMIDKLVSDGVAANKAELARKAIEYFAEQQAIEDVLRAEREPTLRGDFKELIKKFK
jgi:Arc/MetJ-type ribon-helix-helix transcriptional regulator